MRFRRVLIANRGEIALRVMRTCEALGIETVLAASEADLDSVPARRADRVIRIGKAPPAQSYLDWRAIATAAAGCGADAVHPGYGFLSENALLARACRDVGVVFIGASEEQLGLSGDKWRARETAVAAGLPVVPGATVSTLAEAERALERIGCPALVKAVGGGGGRGMKRIDAPEQLAATIELAIAEAQAAFGDPRVYIERLVTGGRHIEVQLIGDGELLVHAGERDCSVQRRYQKLIEETPAPHLKDGLRAKLHAAALAFGKALAYRGLGTVEFLVDDTRDEFFFLEMNARIQVEHPVTEAVTGLDLVREQIAVAEGRPLALRQDDIHAHGHAIELRLNAEDPLEDFRPSPGRITRAVLPAGPGIRVDTHIGSGAAVPPFYDSLLAKLIVHAADRTQTIALAKAALANTRIEGVATNVAMHQAVLADPTFVAGGVGTDWFAHAWPTLKSQFE
jgi:acetyl-CoA carboxylase, biotin carboxylase subunit